MPDKDPVEHDKEEQSGLATATKPTVKQPRRYKVLLHNDDYTTMEFVVDVLVTHFNKSQTEATQIMLSVHHRGHGICGVFTREIAETKVAQVQEYARKNGMPLKCTMEAE
jgi:ATP-dependent Clp protease adaptor protein ClpS